MLKEFFVIKVFPNETSERDVVRTTFEHIVDKFPTDEQIEELILHYYGCNGYAEVVKRYAPVIPFT